MKSLKVLFPVLTILCGCATINYIGTSYPPTDNVDLYFSEADIEKEYRVVGRIVATADADEMFYSSEKFTEAILKKAREKGADGVVISEFGNVATGVSESRERTEETKEKRDKWITVETENVSSSVEEKRRIEALAIKYKVEE